MCHVSALVDVVGWLLWDLAFQEGGCFGCPCRMDVSLQQVWVWDLTPPHSLCSDTYTSLLVLVFR